MNKYWKYELFPSFLESVQDCTYSSLEDDALFALLVNVTKFALKEFIFPKMSLSYDFDDTIDPLDNQPYGEYFINEDIGESEYYVILAFMKAHWVKQQIAIAKNFKNPYYDKNITGFSPAALLQAMEKMYATFLKDAKRIRFDYSRLTKEGTPRLGRINGQNKG